MLNSDVPLSVSKVGKQLSKSEKRLIRLEKRGFEVQAQKLRSEYNNQYMLNEIKLRAKSNKKVLTEISHEKIGHFLKPTKIITATAHKWAIYDFYSSKYIRGYRSKDSHQLNVFSKLLVFCAVNTIVERYAIDTNRFQTIVTEGVLKLHKNTSLLKADDIVSLEDLLHLMIMEESEVYETILAVNVGAYLQRKRQKEYYSVYDTKDKNMKDNLKIFYELVNSYCQLLKLDNIRYIQSDPELRKEKNKGSASDIAIISIQCLKVPLFMAIMKKLSHEVTVKFINSHGNLINRNIQILGKSILNKYIPYSNVCRNWDQNNFMDSHCSIFYQGQEQIRPIVVVLLGCYGPSDREKDIQQIVEWYLKNGRLEFDQESREEEMGESKLKKSSSIKLAALPNKEISKKISQKLQIVSDKEMTKRYDQAIKFKAQMKGSRLKTQF